LEQKVEFVEVGKAGAVGKGVASVVVGWEKGEGEFKRVLVDSRVEAEVELIVEEKAEGVVVCMVVGTVEWGEFNGKFE
jgi:hypothetical protein